MGSLDVLRRLLAPICAAVAVFACLLPASAPAAAPPSGPPATIDGPSGRTMLGGLWLLRRDHGDAGVGQRWQDQRGTGGWRRVRVPYSWNANDNRGASMRGSVSWYRRDFRLPRRGRSRPWLVRFLSVNHRATIWLNGRRIGFSDQPYLPFEVALRGARRRGVNRLVVRTDSRRRATDFPQASSFPGRGVAGGWWNYGGIVREVEMRPAAAADVSDVRATADLPCARCAGVVRVRAVVRNTTRRSMRPVVVAQIARRRVVLGRPLLRPGQKTSVAARIFVLQPRVWSPADPQLERLTVTATARGRTGRHVVHVGIRGIRVVDGRLELNGQPLRVNGLGIHEDQHLRGHATTRAWRRQLMRWARETGGTMLRTHYPLHPDLIEQADRLGMLVWSEIPVYSMRSGELARANVIDRAAALARRNAAQNAHHPSILTWSVGNELAAAPGPVEVELFQRQADAIRSVDRTRPVSIALRFAKQAGCFDAYAPFDLIGQNQYFGWYYKRLSDLRPYMDRLRACYPQKAIMSTEFGVEANRDGPDTEKGTYAYQSAWTARQLQILRGIPWLSGETYWALNEFKVRPSWAGGNPKPDPPMHRKGLFSYEGAPKPALRIVREAFKRERPGADGDGPPGRPEGTVP